MPSSSYRPGLRFFGNHQTAEFCSVLLTVQAVNGSIGAPGGGANTVAILSRNGIDRVEAKNVYAAVSSNFNRQGGPFDGVLQRFLVTQNFVGSLSTEALYAPGDVPEPLFVGGTVDAPIIVTTYVSAPIKVGSVVRRGGANALTVGTALLGNVTATTGSLDGLVVAGAVGGSGSPVTIQSIGECGPISASGSINANITVGTATRAALASLTTGPGQSFAGSLQAATLGTSVIGGSLLGSVNLTTGLASGATLRVQRSLPSTGSVSLGASGVLGLGGQVLINGAASNPAGEWAGTVSVGGTSLSGTPEYSTPSAVLGLGAVGLAPFAIYRQDCFPPQASASAAPLIRNSAFDDANTPPIRIRFYGPITLPTGTTNATNTIRVVREATGGDVDVTADWSATIGSVPFNPFRKELQLSFIAAGGVPITGTYRVETAAAPAPQLACDLGLSTNPAVQTFTYKFTVTDEATGCGSYELDYNQDSVVNPDDLGDFITDYYTDPLVAGPGGYAIACPENSAPFTLGYKAAYTLTGSGQCFEPNPDNLGDYITQYYAECV